MPHTLFFVSLASDKPGDLPRITLLSLESVVELSLDFAG
jgi:hypothetical protein